jgi:TetR/AcrR family transcriptional repressor of nem operon
MTIAHRKPRTDTRDELIRVGAEIIAQKGFNNTGLEEILKAASVPKGSFYYYFDSKEDFGLAVVDSMATDVQEHICRLLKDSAVPPLQRIRNWIEAGIDRMDVVSCCRGCPIGSLSQEMASQHDVFRRRLEDIFQQWKASLATVLEEARAAGEIRQDSDVDALAECLLMGWEGASLRAIVTKSTKPLEQFRDILFTRVLV